MKSLAQHLDYLHEIVKQYKLSDVKNLPEIVVVGDQSSGKSSLLQSIIKKDILPHGDKLVTRCPIRVLTSKHEREYATFPDIPDEEFKISDISNVLQKKNKVIEKEEYISSKDILVNLYGPDMLNMTLVDLPGIVKVRLENQPENIVSKVEKLIKDRIKNENTLILAVVSAANDIASSSALGLAKSVDPLGKRTIIVFTMMDRCQHPNNIVEGFEIISELGFLGVICRSPSQVLEKMTINQQFEYESQYFDQHKVFTNYKNILGMDNLITKIEFEFRKSVFNSLPTLKSQIDSKIEIIMKEIEKLGEPVQYLENQMLFVQRLFEKMIVKMTDIIDGKDLDTEHLKIDGISFRENFLLFNEKLKEINIEENDKIFVPILNSIKRSRGLEGVSSISLQLLKKAMKSLTEPFREIQEYCLNSIKFQFGYLFKALLPDYCSKYQMLFDICLSSFEEVLNENQEDTNIKLVTLIELEYETIESDFDDGAATVSIETFFNFIETMFERSKENLKYNMPKIIKHFFIRKSLNDIKERMISVAVSETNRGVDLIPEAVENEKKRKNFEKAKDGLRKLKVALEGFKRTLI